MGQFRQRMREIAARQAAKAPAATLAKHLEDAGDAFELAARCALGAFTTRERRGDESDVFRVGYLTACKELAVVLRAMRRGGPPSPAELAEARREAIEEIKPTGSVIWTCSCGRPFTDLRALEEHARAVGGLLHGDKEAVASAAVPDAPPGTVVHMLYHGYPLCGFTTEIPANWPEGHSWVSVMDAEHATCPECIRREVPT